MADPIVTLKSRFAAAIAAACGAEHAGEDPAIRRSNRADYQVNAAMALGKRLGKAPRDVAAAIVAHLAAEDLCSKVEVAGPGFINLTLRGEYVARELADTIAGGSLGIVAAQRPQTVIVDYSSPNLAKEMHVGHLRSTILGDAIVRVLGALGHRVVRRNHVGDWGTQFGMLIEHLQGAAQSAAQLSVGDLDEFYRAARARFDSDPAFADRARARVVQLQAGDAAALALWQKLVEASAAHFESVYRALGVLLTRADLAGESTYNAELAGVIAELDRKGLVRESDGALCVFPEGFKGREGEPLPLIVRKQDGGYGYATTDLAAIRQRLVTLDADRLIYVVGSPQSQHFEMVFATARAAGWLAPPKRAQHMAFGSVLGPDKKMFKTRSGETVKLKPLLEEAAEHAAKLVRDKNPELGAAEVAAVARAVGVGAVKYADLANDRIRDYVFDWHRMLSLDGNTAPYLLYAHVRARSIARKSVTAPGAIRIEQPAEHALALDLLRFGAVLADVAESLEPHRLCGYLYELAGAFTSFYEQCPVLKAEDPATRASRLALAEHTADVLRSGLGLLGIEAPDRM